MNEIESFIEILERKYIIFNKLKSFVIINNYFISKMIYDKEINEKK